MTEFAKTVQTHERKVGQIRNGDRKKKEKRAREREMGRIWILEASEEKEMRQKNKISRMKLRFRGERLKPNWKERINCWILSLFKDKKLLWTFLEKGGKVFKEPINVSILTCLSKMVVKGTGESWENAKKSWYNRLFTLLARTNIKNLGWQHSTVDSILASWPSCPGFASHLLDVVKSCAMNKMGVGAFLAYSPIPLKFWFTEMPLMINWLPSINFKLTKNWWIHKLSMLFFFSLKGNLYMCMIHIERF